MEYEKIKQLMKDMENSKLTELNIDFPDGTKISMKKEEKSIDIVTKNPKEITEVEKDIIQNEKIDGRA